MVPYQYARLEQPEAQIRAIHVQPADNLTDTLVCKLDTVILPSRAQPYVTLSYAWGKTSADGSHLTDTLEIDGATLPITCTLRDGLRRIRSHLLSGVELSGLAPMRPQWPPLWIDAICINQKDVNERSAQVAIMADIYARASGMIIWLGELAAPFTSEVTDKFAAEISKTYGGIKHQSTLDDAVAAFRSCAWFYRRWVVQEMWHSRYRTTMVSSTLLTNDDSHFEILYGEGLEEFNALLFHYGSGDQDILHWMHMFSGQLCSDPRDKVYALRSLSTDHDWLTVDYSEDTETLYRRVAMHYVQYKPEQIERLLAAACIYRRSMGPRVHDGDVVNQTNLPSWVPDWRQEPCLGMKMNNLIRDLQYVSRSRESQASANTSIIAACSDNGKNLTVRGSMQALVPSKVPPQAVCDNHGSLLDQAGMSRQATLYALQDAALFMPGDCPDGLKGCTETLYLLPGRSEYVVVGKAASRVDGGQAEKAARVVPPGMTHLHAVNRPSLRAADNPHLRYERREAISKAFINGHVHELFSSCGVQNCLMNTRYVNEFSIDI